MRTVHQNDAFGIAPMRDTLYSPRYQMTRTEKSPLCGLCKSVAARDSYGGRQEASWESSVPLYARVHSLNKQSFSKGHLSPSQGPPVPS